MNRVIFLATVCALSLGAVEVSINAGGNCERWRDYKYAWCGELSEILLDYAGFGFNGGAQVTFGFTNPASPAFMGIKTGVGYLRLNYVQQLSLDSVQVIRDGELVWVRREPNIRHCNQLVIPAVFNIGIPVGDRFRWGVEAGPFLLYKLPWTELYKIRGEIYEGEGPSELDMGFAVGANIGLRIAPRMFLEPSLKAYYNLTADDPGGNLEWERFYALSLGLVFKL